MTSKGALLSLVLTLLTVDAYPAFYMVRNLPQLQHPQNALQSSELSRLRPSKRAFDRLDASSFDFDSISKRFSDDELAAMPLDDLYLSSPYAFGPFRKRSFDRLEESAFFGQKRKRSFGPKRILRDN
uniref:Uncharacterized protein n=1 Tax=Globodera rostochiensis TaxID=31243 RepID=A0A914HNA9_GLORO